MKKVSRVIRIALVLAAFTSAGATWELKQGQTYAMARMQPYFDAMKASQNAMILQQWHDRLQRDAALRAARPHADPNLPQAVYLAPHTPLRNGR